MNEMRLGSLFTGIGGFDEGLERAGMRVLWQSEINPYCCKILSLRWPDVRLYGEISEVGADAEPVDVICGGFPCQSVSHNGHGLVQADERWLWPEFARVVRVLRPPYVLLENVAALVGRGFDEVIADLAALRYDAEWGCVPASAVGAPHRRERLFLVAYPESVGCEEGPRVFTREFAEDLRCSPAWRGLSDRNPDGLIRLVPPPDVLRVADGLPDELDRLAALGNSLVPQIAERIGRRLMERA